jgi:hypothetical protein
MREERPGVESLEQVPGALWINPDETTRSEKAEANLGSPLQEMSVEG